MPSPSYVSAGSVTRGIASAQTGINIESQTETFENPKDYILDRFGGRSGFAYNFDESSTVTLGGEVNTDDDAVLGVAFGTALTVANSTTGYGIASGGYYLDQIQISMSREAKKSASVDLTRIEGIT